MTSRQENMTSCQVCPKCKQTNKQSPSTTARRPWHNWQEAINLYILNNRNNISGYKLVECNKKYISQAIKYSSPSIKFEKLSKFQIKAALVYYIALQLWTLLVEGMAWTNCTHTHVFTGLNHHKCPAHTHSHLNLCSLQ